MTHALAILFVVISIQAEAKSPYLIVCQGARCAVTSDSACNLFACYRGHRWYPPIPKHWIPES